MFEFEMIGLDFSQVERESSKNVHERYNHFRRVYIPEDKDGNMWCIFHLQILPLLK